MIGKKIKMALYDSDGYMISLVKYLCKKKQEIVETRLFTNLSMLQDYLKKGQVDVLLAQEEEADHMIGLQGFVPKLILLTEGNTVREASDFIPVFRYQSAEEMVREILEAVAEDDRIVYAGAVLAQRQGEIICGYSPFGGAGVSTFLMDLATDLAEKYSTLFISLEEFHGMEQLPPGKKGQQREEYRGMSEVIFYLQQRKEKLALKLDSLVYTWNQVDYLLAVENYCELYQMTKEDMKCFLQMLCYQTGYERLIFDVGYLGEAGDYLLEESDRIYMPLPKTPVQERKQRSWEQTWERQGKGKLLKTVCQVDMGER